MQERSQNMLPIHALLRKLVEECFPKMRINEKEKGIQQDIQYRKAKGIPRKILRAGPSMTVVNTE